MAESTEQLVRSEPLQSTTVDADVVCHECGYNLRGLLVSGRCPECGRDVIRSMRGDLLRYSEKYLRGLVVGMTIVYGSIVAALVALVLAAIETILLAPMFPKSQTTLQVTWAAVGVCWLAVILMYPIGWWRATADDPTESSQRRKRRLGLRLTAVLFFPLLVVWLATLSAGYSGVFRIGPIILFSPNSKGLIIELVTHVCFIAMWLHLAFMARQMSEFFQRCELDKFPQSVALRMRLKRNDRNALYAPALLLLIHWVFGLVVYKYAGTNSVGPGLGLGSGLGCTIMCLLWFSCIGWMWQVLKALRHEQDCAQREDALQSQRLTPLPDARSS